MQVSAQALTPYCLAPVRAAQALTVQLLTWRALNRFSQHPAACASTHGGACYSEASLRALPASNPDSNPGLKALRPP